MPSLIDRSGNVQFFGQLSWANFLDWLITLCLAAILVITSLQLGGVRPETQHSVLPLYAILLLLHGLWIAIDKERPRRISPGPVLFLPFLIFASLSFYFLSPVPWRASYELTYFFGIFIFIWVAVNNVRSRAHLLILILMALIPAGSASLIGFYQFFQDSTQVASASVGYALELNQQYFGRATGIFADPNSFAAYLLALLPCFIIAALVPRLPIILRVLCFYVGLVLLAGITFTQTYWAAASVVILMAILPWFCFKKKSLRVLSSMLVVGSALVVFLLMFLVSPSFQRGFARALSTDGEAVRIVLWQEGLRSLSRSPFLGSGGGTYAFQLDHSDSLSIPYGPVTPQNDYMLILGQYGLLGGALLFVPGFYLILRAYLRWKSEAFDRKLKGQRERVMSPQKFFLSIATSGILALLIAAFFTSVLYIPGLLLFGALLFSVLVKLSFSRTLNLPNFRFAGLSYLSIAALFGVVFWINSSSSIESQAYELRARQSLNKLVEKRVPISGNIELIENTIHRFKDAVVIDPNNADAWIGLSSAICQLYYSRPEEFEAIASRAVSAASRAYEICPEYWLSSAQLGIALALGGELEDARSALERSVAMAPNSSNAHYYLASYLSVFPEEREGAIEHVGLSLEINPRNAAALKLQRKLLIL
ncbi:MAG: O-antigen ligase family protein [Verrucomicrobiota bacterium]